MYSLNLSDLFLISKSVYLRKFKQFHQYQQNKQPPLTITQ